MTQFNKITANSDNFNAAIKQFESLSDRFDFDALIGAYNDLQPSELISFEFKAGKSSMIRAQLQRRGLVSGTDFAVKSAKIEGKEGVAIIMLRRLSAKTPGTPAKAPPRKKKAAADAGTTGTPATPSAQTDKAGGKGK